MKIVAHTFVSLDGVMQGPGGAQEDTSGGFDLGGWVTPLFDETGGRIVAGWFAATDCILLGHNTFDIFSGYWPQVVDPDDPIAAAINTRPKYVAATRAVDPGPWADHTTVLGPDLLTELTSVKAQPGGELQIHGSHGLLQSLHGTGLIDEYRVCVFPVILGRGKRLFEVGTRPSGFEVVGRESTDTGVTVLTLTPKPYTIGHFAIQDGRDTAVVA